MTVDSDRRMIDPGTVIIEDQHIAAVGAASEIKIPASAEIINARGMVVLPGFINCHTHASSVLLRGTAASHDRDIFDWLLNALYPGLNAFELRDVRTAKMLYCVEAIRSGTTCIVDNEDGFQDYTIDAAARALRAYEDAGIRAVYARMMFDRSLNELGDFTNQIRSKEPRVVHSDFTRSTDKNLSEVEHLMRTHNRTANGRIQVWPSPSHPATATERLIRASARLAAEHNTMWTMHYSNREGVRVQDQHSMTELFHENGLLDARLLAAHCHFLDETDVQLFKSDDVRVATLPVSNGYLAMGNTPLVAMLDAGITVALGTDDVNCNESVNMLGDMKSLALIWRTLENDPSVLSPEKILEMATIDGARAVGMQSSLGSIEEGKLADVILVDLRHAQTSPSHHFPATLVFAAYGTEVDTVIIDGRIVMRGRELSFIDAEQEHELFRAANEASARINLRAGLEINRRWPLS